MLILEKCLRKVINCQRIEINDILFLLCINKNKFKYLLMLFFSLFLCRISAICLIGCGNKTLKKQTYEEKNKLYSRYSCYGNGFFCTTRGAGDTKYV